MNTRISQAQLRRVMNSRNNASIAAIRELPSEKLEELVKRSQKLLVDEQSATVYEYVPRAKQAETARAYRKALHDNIALAEAILRERKASVSVSPLIEDLTRPESAAAVETPMAATA